MSLCLCPLFVISRLSAPSRPARELGLFDTPASRRAPVIARSEAPKQSRHSRSRGKPPPRANWVRLTFLAPTFRTSAASNPQSAIPNRERPARTDWLCFSSRPSFSGQKQVKLGLFDIFRLSAPGGRARELALFGAIHPRHPGRIAPPPRARSRRWSPVFDANYERYAPAREIPDPKPGQSMETAAVGEE